MLKTKSTIFAALLFLMLSSVFPVMSFSAESRCKVLVVMSYEQGYPWVKAIRTGIQQTLGDSCDVKYFHMDTKNNVAGGIKKAKEAYDLFVQWQPDGVIAADDNAQSMFVFPYLSNKVKTPVMFCGVNADPALYGYPSSNVSGILERLHIRESIAFAQQLVQVNSVCFIMKESPVATLLSNQINKEKDSYTVTALEIKRPKTFDEAMTMTKQMSSSDCDLLFIETMEGIPDAKGNPLTSKYVIPAIVETFAKPTIGTDVHSVNYGVLCSVIKSGEEQGETAATMLLQAMTGTAMQDIPITRNFKGKRLLNVTTMKTLGIKARPTILRGTELVKTDE